METITTNTKKLELTGEETQVHFLSAYPYFWVRNDGSTTVQMSISPNIVEGGDGVIEVLAGSSAGTMHGYNATRSDLYLLGSGKVQVMGTYTPENPFRNARKGGENYTLDGLAYNINMITEASHIDWSGYQYLNAPFTIEFCGSYTKFYATVGGIGTGRWFMFGDGSAYGYGASQRENTFQIKIANEWFDTGETDITVDKNEFVSISMVVKSQTVDLYKNGIFIKTLTLKNNVSTTMFAKIYFLNDPTVSSRSLNGKVNSLRIYDRELTANEILNNANADKIMYFKEEG